jgi:hypothetical protein
MIIPRTPSSKPSATTSLDENELSHLSERDIRRLALERLHDTQVNQLFKLGKLLIFETRLAKLFAVTFWTSFTDLIQVKDEFSQVKREAEEDPRTPRQWKFVRLEDGKEAVDLTDD